MFCTKCGARNDNGGNFCTQCGAAISRSPATNERTTKHLPRAAAVSAGALILVLVVILALFLTRGSKENDSRSDRGHETSGTQALGPPPAYNAGIEKKFLYIMGLAKAGKYTELADRYGCTYPAKKRHIRDQFSFDHEEMAKRMNRLDADVISKIRGAGFGGEYLTVGETAKILFRDGHAITVLEKKQESDQSGSREETISRRMVIKVTYPEGNRPLFLEGGNYITREGIYDSREAVVARFENYAREPHTWSMGEPDSTREALKNELLPNHAHDISEAVLIVEDRFKPNQSDFVKMPNLKTYSIKCADGHETRRSFTMSFFAHEW